MLHYAETHFRFPVSRLYRREPVILIDAPFQICPDASCPIWLIARKANLFAIYVEEIYGEWKNTGGKSIPFKLPVEKQFTEKFHFEELNFEKPQSRSGLWMLNIFVKYQINGREKICNRWNYPFLPPEPLIINFLKEDPPKPEGWLAVETHCHSSYTSDSVEFGAAPIVLQKAAKSVGLDFVCITDHSYDLMNEKKFQKMRNDVESANAGAKNFLPLLIAGEEVSCGNSKNQNVHLLVFGNENYIEGHGDGGRRWWNTKPDLSIREATRKNIAYAAHPKLQMLLAEKILLKRGHWSYKDLTENNICGIEFWNGFRGRDFYEGRDLWIKSLLAGHRLLPLGGNDAHGDLNDYTAVKQPLWSLKCNSEHVFGQVRTVIPNNGKTPFSSVPKNLYITDGPALWFENGKLYAKSTEDFGKFLSITIFRGCPGKPNFEKKRRYANKRFL
ncbi:hypothetical protein R83H12_02255 [Fibrobacteria bacterium R8-3-H12]